MTPHTAVMGPHLDSAALLARLRDQLGYRRMREGFETIENIRARFATIEPKSPHGILAGLIAQWVDAGFGSESLVRSLLLRFPKASRQTLPLLDYLHLRTAEALVAMANEDLTQAINHLIAVNSFTDEIQDDELLAIASYWLGRCYRRMGRYAEALRFTEHGEERALACGYKPMAAIMQTTRSWLAFQKGRFSDAKLLLSRAEAALDMTDDALSRGNIQSAYGRIARRQGRLERAGEYFDNAIAEYRHCGGDLLQLARALGNLAFVKRELALHAQKDLDRVAAARRSEARTIESAGPLPRDARRLEIERIRAEAWSHLQEATTIYSRHQNQHGIASVHVIRGFLYLDSGDLECAASEAAEAFVHGEQKSDNIIMARARILECIAEHAAIEEQLGDSAGHRDAAEAFARDAVTFAGNTENRRLLARAYVWRGLTFACEPADMEAAHECAEKATALLESDTSERQYVWEDLEILKSRVARQLPVDAELRAWCNGLVERKSFQQISEEFARIVIPRVWEREGRKVSRVAEKLSVSPKKVRRILHSAGFLEQINE